MNAPPARFVVCTTRIASGRPELCQMVVDLGGRTTDMFAAATVTHVVAGIPNTTKCSQASEAGIPIVQESWVRASWLLWKDSNGPKLTPESRDRLPLAPVLDHGMPPLRGQVLCVTGQGFTDRQGLQQRIENLGGKYMGKLDKNKVTMLLCDNRSATGQKLTAALNWNIPPVTVEWLDTIEKVKAWRKFERYYVDAWRSKRGLNVNPSSAGLLQSHSSSLPQQSSSFVPPPPPPSFSSLSTSLSASMSASSAQIMVANSVDSQGMLPVPSIPPNAVPSLKQRAMSAPPEFPPSQPFISTTALTRATSRAASSTDLSSSEPPSKAFVVALQNFVQARKKICGGLNYSLEEAANSMCLDGCRISSCGFPNSVHGLVQRCLRMALRNTGAIFVDEIQNARATHVVVPDEYVHIKERKQERRQRGEKQRTHYVRLSWLTQSIEAGVCEDPATHAAPSIAKSSAAVFTNLNNKTDIAEDGRQSKSKKSSSSDLTVSNNGTSGNDERNKRKRGDSKSVSQNSQAGGISHKQRSHRSQHRLPLHGAIVCVTGFRARELKDVEHMAIRLGADFTQTLAKNCTFLVCKRPEGAKYLKACTWKQTEIVTLHWLQECERTQSKVALNDKRYWYRKESHQPKRKKRKKKLIAKTAPTASAVIDIKPTRNNTRGNKHSAKGISNRGIEDTDNEEIVNVNEDVSALARKLIDGQRSSNNHTSMCTTGSADKKMQEDLLALVKKKVGERTPSNSQPSQHDVDVPPDYYTTSIPRAMGTPVSPLHGNDMLSSHGDDESQGVRWGSEDEGVYSDSDSEEDNNDMK